MTAVHAEEETLRLSFERDEDSHLPLLAEADTLLDLTLNYLPLPHSVVEFGCGKKASLILDLLAGHGVPVHGLRRGLILEADMSRKALETSDYRLRPHAMHVSNPLYRRALLNDVSLRRMMRDEGFVIEDGKSAIQVGEYEVHHVRTVQFAIARSHIYPIVTFWNPEGGETVDRVIDPTLDRDRMFPVPDIRDYLHGPEALIFSAPMLGRFRLDPEHLTDRQRRELEDRMAGAGPVGPLLRALDDHDHADLVRDMTGAPVGSIGDPETWSYANNIRPSGDRAHDELQAKHTGVGDKLLAGMREFRNDFSHASQADIREGRKRLHGIVAEMDIRRRMSGDAVWSGKKLDPLARLASVISSHLSLRDLANAIRQGGDARQRGRGWSRLSRVRPPDDQCGGRAIHRRTIGNAAVPRHALSAGGDRSCQPLSADGRCRGLDQGLPVAFGLFHPAHLRTTH